MSFLKHIVSILIIVNAVASCKKMIEVPQPSDQLIDEAVFTDNRSAESAMVGLYSEMMRSNNTLSSGAISVLPSMSADEVNYNSTNSGLLEFYQNAISASNSNNQSIWKSGYSYLYQTNAIINGLTRSTNLSDSIKNQLTGEAKFMRAWIYYYLINIYGDVPMVIGTDYTINAQLPRQSKADILVLMIEDLKQAKQLLPTSLLAGKRTRPNSAAASFLLARVYLLTNAWGLAETEATEVINNSNYSLLSQLSDVFLSGSKEAILQLQPVNPSLNTYEGNTFIPTSSTVIPPYTLTNDLFNLFSTTDKRRSNWTKTNTVSSINYNYPFKYKVRIATTITENSMLFRLAEIYLIRAEARMELNKISGVGGALEDVNTIRRRAGIPDLNGLDQSQTRAAIETESRLELFCEWGHRWITLKRTGRVDAVLAPLKASAWQSTDSLFPIPQTEIDRNGLLLQNPGY